MERVPSLLAQARQTPLGASAELHAVAADAYLMLNGDGDIDSAHERVVAAINAYGGDFDANDRALIAAIDILFIVCLWGGRADLWRSYPAALARLIPAAPEADVLLINGFDPVRATPAVLRGSMQPWRGCTRRSTRMKSESSPPRPCTSTGCRAAASCCAVSSAESSKAAP